MTQFTLREILMEDENDAVVMVVAVMASCEEHFVLQGSYLEIYTGYQYTLICQKS